MINLFTVSQKDMNNLYGKYLIDERTYIKFLELKKYIEFYKTCEKFSTDNNIGTYCVFIKYKLDDLLKDLNEELKSINLEKNNDGINEEKSDKDQDKYNIEITVIKSKNKK